MMVGNAFLLSQLLDDYVAWFALWHRATTGRGRIPPVPARFAAWRDAAVQSLAGEQPAIERLTTLHEQLHKLVKLILIKAEETPGISPADDDSITAKYLELMQELRRFEQAFAMAASDLDALTGLRTRLRLLPDLEQEISRSSRTKRPFFVAIMDIDHFKRINDSYGHDSGDKVLAVVANHISRSLRAHDDAYRYGGEEFLLCLKETDAAGGLLALERLRGKLEKTPVTLADGKTIPVTASFGMAESGKGATAEELIRKADEALYKAKNSGRNKVIVSA